MGSFQVKCQVKPMYKNLRYRFLITESNYYIVDMGHSYFKILFPFLFWLFPTPIYKLEDVTLLEKFKSPNDKIETRNQEKNKVVESKSEITKENESYSGWGAILGFLVAGALTPLRSYSFLPDTLVLNIIITCIIGISILALIRYVHGRCQNTVCRYVNLKKLERKKILFRSIPTVPSLHPFAIVGMYFIILLFTVILFEEGVNNPDVLTHFFLVIVFSVYSITHAYSLLPGQARVQFKNT